MFPHTGARADRFSATLAHLVFALAVALALLGFAALAHLAVLPLWAWLFVAPDTLAVVVGGFLLALAARESTRGAYR
jgi:hypothetical protein